MSYVRDLPPIDPTESHELRYARALGTGQAALDNIVSRAQSTIKHCSDYPNLLIAALEEIASIAADSRDRIDQFTGEKKS